MECQLLVDTASAERKVVLTTYSVERLCVCFTSLPRDNVTNLKTNVELFPLNSIDTKTFRNLFSGVIFGCLGVIHVGEDDFLCVITQVSLVGTILGKMLYQIQNVSFVSLSSSEYDDRESNPYFAVEESAKKDIAQNQYETPKDSRHPCEELAKYISSRSFYFAYSWDCTKNLQKTRESLFKWEDCEKSFFWNRFILHPIDVFAKSLAPISQKMFLNSGLFVVCFQGFAEIRDFPFGSENAALALISRVSCRRAGTRFRSRGIDDDGNVSNFVESETLFAYQNLTFSYISVRGTVPVFWDQQGFQLGFPKIQLTRTPAATQYAFDKHISNLKSSYGLVHILNLLNQKEGQAENVLSTCYEFHIRKYPEVGILSQTTFDIYSVCKNSNFERLDALFHLIGRDLQVFGYYVTDESQNVLKEQKGIFRVNCLDCLDRTNIIQNYVTKRALDLFLRNYLMGAGVSFDSNVFHSILSDLWTANGDQLSRIYTGSDAIKSSYGRLGKFTLTSFMEDVKNTAKRFYANNFTERSRQQSIDIFLGKYAGQQSVILFSTESEAVQLELSRRTVEFCRTEKILIQVLTWNTNGSMPSSLDDFGPLLSIPKEMSTPHIVAIGFQEIVQLNATQIMSVDPERRILWEGHLIRELKNAYFKDFSLLVAHQLVGTTISVFVRLDYLDSVRQVEIASKKTGMGGIAGNKGSVAVRMRIYDSSFCFVSSHFAAGQNNSADRDRDMMFATNELQMSGGKNILMHDNIVWFGDLNYRIDLDREIVRDLIIEKNFTILKEYDQLLEHIREGLVFNGFSEGELNFGPTYKYDPGTNIYDSSEKLRVPSWTDRILFKGDMKCHFYDRAEIDISDHKPVKGLFEATICKIDREKESTIKQEIVDSIPVNQTRSNSEAETIISSFDLMDHSEATIMPPTLPPRPKAFDF